MKIRTAINDDFREICEYNKRTYQEKSNIDIYKYIGFWFSQTPNEPSKTLLLVDDNDKIVGQNFFSSMSYYYSDETIESTWGFDLMVDEKYRKETWGIDLMMAGKKANPLGFATGSNDNALALNIKLGCKNLGRLKKYVGLVSPIRLFSSFKFRRKSFDKFPENLTSNGQIFKRIDFSQFPDLTKPFNNDLLEISRKRAFLTWRFHNKLHDYIFYQSQDSNDYFVVRTIEKKHIVALVLVDYRCNMNESIHFESIVQAACNLTKELHLALLIVGSSLSICDKVLENNRFRSIGRPRPIIARLKVKEHLDRIENRNFIFVTLADSDGETMW